MFEVSKKIVLLQRKMFRDVAQPGSALRSGRRGRKFESCHPDTKKSADSRRLIFCLYVAGYHSAWPSKTCGPML